MSLPDFARGPRQAIDVPATRAGLSLTISEGTGVHSVDLTMRYDASLLTITGASVPANVPGSVVATTDVPGVLTLHFAVTAPLPAGPVEFVMLTAAVPDSAVYGAAHVLDLSDFAVNWGWLPATAGDAVHTVAYFGDTTGTNAYSGLDAQRIARVVVQLDSGFEAFPRIDPVVIADINSSGTLSGLDAVLVAREVVGLDPPEIPPLPAGSSGLNVTAAPAEAGQSPGSAPTGRPEPARRGSATVVSNANDGGQSLQLTEQVTFNPGIRTRSDAAPAPSLAISALVTSCRIPPREPSSLTRSSETRAGEDRLADLNRPAVELQEQAVYEFFTDHSLFRSDKDDTERDWLDEPTPLVADELLDALIG